MVEQPLAFLPPGDGFYQPPLSRFLPPLPKGVFSAWLENHTNPGDLVIDPLGANPMLALEAASSGRVILFARNNPVIWLMLEVLAGAPTKKEIEAAVSKLLLSRQGSLTLEDQLKSIYASTCHDCGEVIQPDGFIWDAYGEIPTMKVYRCQACGAQGEKLMDDRDVRSLRQLGNVGLQKARALQRAGASTNYEQESIQDALDCYTSRSIFTLMLLVNRLDRLPLEKKERRLLQAILIGAFDEGSAMRHWPQREYRHLQLTVPSPFFEKNLLLFLEKTAEMWQHSFGKQTVTYYPQLPESGSGICLYQRRLADHEDFLLDKSVRAAITLIPRPNQAFWTLSALWAGWLWGGKGSVPMRSALARRRYDWYWFAQAILATLKPITGKLKDDALLFCVFPESAGNFFLGLNCGMRAANLRMVGHAYRETEEMSQSSWIKANEVSAIQPPEIRDLALGYLNARGEPATFNELLMHCVAGLTSMQAISNRIDQIDEGLFRQIQEALAALLRDGHFATALRSSQAAGTRWWLVDTRHTLQPLAERVEHFIVEWLRSHQPASLHKIEVETCKAFKGILTPSTELIHSILTSYTDDIEHTAVKITLNTGEDETARAVDLQDAFALLRDLGRRLGFTVDTDEDDSMKWKNNKGEELFAFYPKTSCDISQLVLRSPDENTTIKVIVLPASRSRLIAHRLREDPRLVVSLENGWRFLKFRHLRRLAAVENLTRELWENLLDGDPMLWDAPEQTPLI
jgi:hypothetical protein